MHKISISVASTAGKLRETQSGPPEKVISYSVRDGEGCGFKTVRWRRQILDEDPEAVAEDTLREELATRQVDMPHVLVSLEVIRFILLLGPPVVGPALVHLSSE